VDAHYVFTRLDLSMSGSSTSELIIIVSSPGSTDATDALYIQAETVLVTDKLLPQF